MSGVTPDQLMTTVSVLLAIFAAIVTVDKVFDIVKKWRSPSVAVIKQLNDMQRRQDEDEKAIKGLQEGQQALCSGIMALLDHELHNGNTEQMQNARDGIMSYLQGKIVK